MLPISRLFYTLTSMLCALALFSGPAMAAEEQRLQYKVFMSSEDHVGLGDAPNSSVVWVPSIKLLVASDLVYDHAHAWLSAAKTPELRQAWLDALDQLEALRPEIVVPGHAPSKEYLSPSSIDYTRQYIKTFIAKLGETGDSKALMAEMERLYPDAGMIFCLEYSARIIGDGWTWEGQWPPALREMKVVR